MKSSWLTGNGKKIIVAFPLTIIIPITILLSNRYWIKASQLSEPNNTRSLQNIPYLRSTQVPMPIFDYAVFDPIPGSDSKIRIIENKIVESLPQPHQLHLVIQPGQTSRLDLDALMVVYTNTAMGSISDNEINQLQAEISKTSIFLWRQSHLKFRLNSTYLIIDEFKDFSEFTEVSDNGYWLFPDDGDRDGESIENDLLALGITENQYDSINIFWAHNGSYGVAYGGLGGGIYWALGFTGITMNPIAWWFSNFESGTAFPHEFQHTLDWMFEVSGYTNYFFPDQPWEFLGAFGENWDFWAFGMRGWPSEHWLNLSDPWGTIVNSPDADIDGVPDTPLDIFLTENSLGSSSDLRDTDGDKLQDLDEAMAGLFTNTSLNGANTDADPFIDGDDLYALYGSNVQIILQSQVLDGNTTGWDPVTDQLFEQNSPFDASIWANWDEDYFYLMFIEDRYAYITAMIDADNDGWFHGRDNYEITVGPNFSTPTDPNIVSMAHIWDSSNEIIELNGVPMWDDDPNYPGARLIQASDIERYAKNYQSGYLIQIAIPRNTNTGMELTNNSGIGINITFRYLDYQPDTIARFFEKDAWFRMVFVQQLDTLPPSSWTNSLPAIVQSSSFEVTWSGEDGESGISLFDVQYRDGADGEWINCKTKTSSVSGTFTGQNQHTYYFRTRAWDKGGNVEQFPFGDGDTWTKIILPPTPTPGPRIIKVPEEYPTINAAMNVAEYGDIIQVSNGTYKESTTIKSGVTLLGNSAWDTIIDGGGSEVVVYLNDKSILQGFTVMNSGSDYWDAGIWVIEGTPFIAENMITGNSMGIVFNCFSECYSIPRIQNNIVYDNLFNGIYAHNWQLEIINNTVIGNGSTGIAVDTIDTLIMNNLSTDNGFAGISGDNKTIQLGYNNVWDNQVDYYQVNPGETDISTDPFLVFPAISNFHLKSISPNIDAGTIVEGMSIDIDGELRPFDGDGDGKAYIDIGADEYIGALAFWNFIPLVNK